MASAGGIAASTRPSLATGQKPLWDVDFSSALENRTGKYFIGRDLIVDQAESIDRIYYWRHNAKAPPGGLASRALHYGLKVEAHAAAAIGASMFPARGWRRPTIHLDPFSATFTHLTRADIILCHDLGPVSHPDLFRPWVGALYRQLYQRIEKAGSRLVFVSMASREAFRRLFGNTQPMKVIYPALRTDIGDGEGNPIPGINARFLLTVGSIGHRKNQAMTIRAFAMSGLAAKGVQYVLCGAQEPGAGEIKRLADRTPGVRLLPYVSNAELAWLYAKASGFVLVSRLEGFGLPVAEAISRGLVPLVTRNSVLEEVAGPGALGASSSSPLEIAAGMNAMVTMTPTERARRQHSLRASIDRFNSSAFATTWRETLGG